MVPEQLRLFVEREGRPPGQHEQAALLQRQVDAERQALDSGARWVVSDAGALMTAVYSTVYFDDRSLLARAAAHHRNACRATLWCDVDGPWIPDPGQRDGPEVRGLTHRTIAVVLAEFDVPATVVGGDLQTRLRLSRSVLAQQR